MSTLEALNLPVNPKSSSSSLRDMEQSIPSFRSFVKRTPPVAVIGNKPLPPTPVRFENPWSAAASLSIPSAFDSNRRSSSVYSRTPSYQGFAAQSWKSADLANPDRLVPMRPVAYSASDTQLVGRQSSDESTTGLPSECDPYLLQPRTYNPLVASSSPTTSGRTSPSRRASSEPRPSISIPPPPSIRQIKKADKGTMTLAEAQNATDAPRAIHFLLEELRALNSGKSRSQEPPTTRSTSIPAPSPATFDPPTLVDQYGRDRPAFPPQSPTADRHLFDFLLNGIWHGTSDHEDEITTYYRDVQADLKETDTNQPQSQSMIRTTPPSDLESEDEARGRTRHRGPRVRSGEQYLPKATEHRDLSTGSCLNDAAKLAEAYHDLLHEQYRQPPDLPRNTSIASEDGVKVHMKMVPQPLFHSKPYTAAAGRKNIIDSMRDSSASSVSDISSMGSSEHESFPLRLSLTPPPHASHERQISSGSIPLSPPSASTRWYNSFDYVVREGDAQASRRRSSDFALQLTQIVPKPAKPRRNSDNGRVSAFYPHTMHRSKDRRPGKKSNLKSSVDVMPEALPPVPLPQKKGAVQKAKMPNHTPTTSPRSPSSTPASPSGVLSDAGSNRSVNVKKALYTRMVRSAVKYADILTRPADHFSPLEARSEQEGGPLVASPDSPHLLPSPVSGKSAPIFNLGWTDHAKNAFDKTRTSTRRRPAGYVHMQTPARPLDESRAGLQQQPDSPMEPVRFFGGMIEGWRESKAQKRREGLKKTIKIVHDER